MSFWGLLLALIAWGCIAVIVWAPWWVSLIGLGIVSGIGLIGLLEYARAPVRDEKQWEAGKAQRLEQIQKAAAEFGVIPGGKDGR